MKRKRTTPIEEDDGRTPEERALDHELKGTFPASDPTSGSGGTATPRPPKRREAPPPDEESRGDQEAG